MNRLAILSAPGSRGDVNPMIAIGSQLLRRGYDVAIALAEPYCQLAEDAGLQAFPIVSREKFQAMLSDPRFWNVVRGLTKVIRGIGAEFLQPHFELIQQLHRPGQTILVSHPLDFASRIYRDLEPSTPLVDIHLAPLMLRCPAQPARLTNWFFEPTRHRFSFRMAYWLGDAVILDPLLAGPVNKLRRRYGLEKVRRVMHQWWLSPDRVLACYPPWFAPATVGLLEQLRHVGFPLSDGSDESFEVPTDKPIVFTGGSANWHTRQFFSQAAAACRQLGRAGLLLGSHDDCFPTDLPSTVCPQRYAPLGKLLPHCSAIVHHGGVGTTSQALRTGTVQLVRPLAFDQFDNAARVVDLHCGICFQKKRGLAEQLDFVLNDSQLHSSVAEIASQLTGPNGAELAALEIDAVMTGRTVED